MRNYGFNGRTFDDLVSVIIPLYRNFDIDRVKISIDSLKQQRNVNLQIIVAEQGDEQRFNEVEGLSYDFIQRDNLRRNDFSIPGFVRNRAAKLASGRYLYNSDGDIVYANPYYFAEILELIKTGEDVVLYRPPMRRLPKEDFLGFKTLCNEFGLSPALNELDMDQEFIASMPCSSVSMVVLRKKESGRLKTFLFTSSDWERYKSNPLLKGSEPVYSTLSVHAGGTFMQREHFIRVGGFCEKFSAWGCHDADLQWKLRSKFNLCELPNFPEYEVIHLDHDRGYFDKTQWQINRNLQMRRRAAGADAAIEEDLNGS